jgi:hypothetical protein
MTVDFFYIIIYHNFMNYAYHPIYEPTFIGYHFFMNMIIFIPLHNVKNQSKLLVLELETHCLMSSLKGFLKYGSLTIIVQHK